MGYQSKTIKNMVVDIESNKVFLPALQRKFVWGKHQIELLFDSLMRNYPIGTFLFWNLKRETAQSYVFYEFLKEYDERHPYNRRKEGAFLQPEIIGVLDGQQRLSSMYIGLQGTHTEKRPYMHRANPRAFEPTKLYLNVLSLPYSLNDKNEIVANEETNFDFCFLTEHESKNWVWRKRRQQDEHGRNVDVEESMYWFRVGEILLWNEDPEYDIIVDDFIAKSINEKQKQVIASNRRFIRKAIETLFKRFTEDTLINYFEVNKTDLEDILKIFVRVNSGGTILSKTDLLFSTIVATWDNGREQIEKLLRDINEKGDGFGFSNDFLMRCCLVLTDSPVLFKVNSFKTENVHRIKDNWAGISSAIKRTVDLLVEFGFNNSLLTSQNSVIIISYYLIKGGIWDATTKKEIKKYLIHSLLNGIYGNSQDQVISSLRSALRKGVKDDGGKIAFTLKQNNFSFEELLKIDLPSRKSFRVTELEIDNFLSYKKSAGSFFVLTLLYPQLRYQEVQFHQDHIHPASKFTKDYFDSISLTEEQMTDWLDRRDMIPNLQLMEGRQNESKNATEFKAWLSQKSEADAKHFCGSNFIPEGQDFDFKNFKSFFESRRAILKNELMKVLAISADAKPDVPNDVSNEDEIVEPVIDYTIET